jgi:hypothetical protein
LALGLPAYPAGPSPLCKALAELLVGQITVIMSTSLAIELKELARVAMPTKLYLRIEEKMTSSYSS